MSPARTLVNRYCVTCHNERRPTPPGAPLMLDKLNVDDLSHSPETWEKVIRKVRSGAMPPAGMPRPDAKTFESWVAGLETTLDRLADARPNPGRLTVHRLNRAEYTNAIRDLVALEVDGRALLPADDSGYGFDNNGDVLSVSPGLLERYMLAAAKISRLAVGDSTLRPGTTTYKNSPLLLQDERLSENLPFGSRGGLAVRHAFPLDGEYVLKINLERPIRPNAEPHQLDVRLDRSRLRLVALGRQDSAAAAPNAPLAADANPDQPKDPLEIRFSTKAGTRLIGVSFVGALSESLPLDARPARPPVSSFAFTLYDAVDPAVSSIQIIGPYRGKVPEDTSSRRRIFVCRPAKAKDEKACAQKVLTALARRAYRRPVTERDIQPLVESYEIGRRKGGFENGIRWALEAILTSPRFLFRIERDPANAAPGTAYRISDLELASRLSFFLWSSIPDDQLLELAERGKLKDSAVLAAEVRRMLADPRSSALVNNFAGQWLYLRNLRTHAPNATLFPRFDDNLREAFQRETELFVESQLREDRSVTELLSANYSFINERLAKHYGIPNVYGSHFRRVTLPDDRRAGLLGHASILTVTSEANRTSPVKRGKWLLENLLGAPPPPPPPNVPALKENDEGGKPTTVRERMELHRKDPVCASCHAQMDPLGFALENFDAIGQWRTMDAEAHTAIDASGVLIDGTKFQGPVDFRQILLGRRSEFINTVIERLLTYALGRGLEYFDQPIVRGVTRAVAPSDYRWSAIIAEIVKSRPFQMRMASEAEGATTVDATVTSPARRSPQP